MEESGIVMKNNKISYSTRFLLIPLILSLILTGILSLFTIRNLQGNARVINYTGIVRGATQRLVKQELNHQADDAMIEKIDGLLNELETGEGPDALIRLDDKAFQAQIKQMRNAWAQMKTAIYDFRKGGSASELYALSETYFDLANDAVSYAEAYTEASVHFSAFSQCFFPADHACLVIFQSSSAQAAETSGTGGTGNSPQTGGTGSAQPGAAGSDE